MRSHVTAEFWRLFARLPAEIQQRARDTYRIWKENPFHPGLRFKRIHARLPIYSVRIGIGWRAVGVRENESIVWYWIGSHADYDNLVG